ncbi:MAG TPA: glutathione S-transferase family protein [Polyangia bacterium]|jgi:GST-like protein|nr:glutathione S-transferase family protein [Polyangia bacterium]
MIELYGDATGNTFRVAVTLEEAGLAYVERKVELARGEHRGAPYRELNATGRVPTIVDPDGPGGQRLVLTQSNAIAFYLAEKSGTLLPADALERARAFEWYFFFLTDVITPSQTAFILKRTGTDFGAAVDAIEARCLSMYDYVERHLADRAFLAGATFSLADIAGYTISVAFWQKLSPAAERYPNLTRWFTSVRERPAVARGMAAFRRPH